MNELNELLDSAILSKLADVHTAFPARIISYDFTTQKANVEPVLNKRLNHALMCLVLNQAFSISFQTQSIAN